MEKLKFLFVLIMASLSMTGCGGGGGGGGGSTPSEPPEKSEGIWVGTTNAGQYIEGVVLDDGTYYLLYSDTSVSYIAGVVQGSSSMNGTSFSSSNAKDFNIEGAGVLSASVSGTIAAENTFNGSITYNDGDVTFTSTYSDDYDVTPFLSVLAGDFSGEVAFSQGFESANISISPDGSITGVGSSGCALTGTTYARTSGNVYNVSITFSGAPCFFANQTLEGIIYYNSTENYIYSITPNSNRTDGVLFVGTKS